MPPPTAVERGGGAGGREGDQDGGGDGANGGGKNGDRQREARDWNRMTEEAGGYWMVEGKHKEKPWCERVAGGKITQTQERRTKWERPWEKEEGPAAGSWSEGRWSAHSRRGQARGRISETTCS